MSARANITLTMPVRQWQTIDGTLDNTVAVEIVGGDEQVAARAGALREVGWGALREHPLAGQGHAGWPPDSADFTVSMPREDWDFIAVQLARWAAADGDHSAKDALEALLA
jgi:hypothetical protein